MRIRIYISLLAVLIVALTASALFGLSPWVIAGEAVAALIVIILIYNAAVGPLKAVQNGVYLLRAQDFSSRLKRTGQAEADKVASLFNGLMDTLRAERLKNLEQENFLGKVVEASPMGIAICDFDGNISETNPAWRELISPGMLSALETLGDDETRTLRLSPSLIVRISRLWFMDRGFRRRFYLAEPLTSEIVTAQKQIFNKIVRTIGHETNNTLGSVISVLETLGEIHASEPMINEAVAGSAKSCDNLVKFVKSYADIVKLPEPKPEAVDFNLFMTRLLPVLRGIAGEEISLRFTPPEEGRELRFDPMLIERVMINVVKNAAESIAAKADDTAGEIVISLSGHTVSVTDNGAGISEEAAQKIFTPFYSTKRPDRGLGLMLISDILHNHNATFTLATDPATGLTTFAFTL